MISQNPSVVNLLGSTQVFAPNIPFDEIYGFAPMSQNLNGDFAKLVSARAEGLFTVVSQLSPMGGHRFEDLAMLDLDDANSQLLLIAKQETDRLVIYRKLYRKGRSQGHGP